MKNKIVKIYLLILSLILIALLAFGINHERSEDLKEHINPTEVIVLNELEKTEAKPVMTQEEMEEEISKHKSNVSDEEVDSDAATDEEEDVEVVIATDSDEESSDIAGETTTSVVDFEGLT